MCRLITFTTTSTSRTQTAMVRMSVACRTTAGTRASVNGIKPPTLPCDVTDEGQVQALIAGAIRELGHIDVLINNAGLGGFAPVVEMRDEQWFKVLDVTLTSVFRMTRAILPHMMERRTGAIVNNASVLGWRAQAGQAHYAASPTGSILIRLISRQSR